MPRSWTEPTTVTPGATVTIGSGERAAHVTFETPHTGVLPHVFATVQGPGGTTRHLFEPRYETELAGRLVRIDSLQDGLITLRVASGWSARQGWSPFRGVAEPDTNHVLALSPR